MYNENPYGQTQKIDDTVQQSDFLYSQNFYEDSYTPDTPPKRSKLPLILGLIALILVLAAVGIFLLPGMSSSEKSTPAEKASIISAMVNDDGTAYIPLFNGESIVIHDDVESASLTADRNHLVVLLSDGTLYVTDPEQSSRSVLSEKCYSFGFLRNDGFFYTEKLNEDEEEKSMYRVLFSDLSQLYLGDNVYDITVAENNTTALFATDDGCILTLPSTVSYRTKVGSFGNADDLELEAISDDGELSVWVTQKDEVQTIVLNEGEEQVTLGDVDYKYNYTYATFTDDQGMLVIRNTYDNRVWIKIPGQEVVRGKVSTELASSALYAASGPFSKAKSSDVSSVYVAAEADSGSDVYRFSLDGDRDRLLSEVKSYRISDGYIIYLDMDSTLYYAKLEEGSISDPVKIAGNVDYLETGSSGLYVYYLKNLDSEEDLGDLYCYKIGSDDAERVSTDVGCFTITDLGWPYADYSSDGSSVFFFKNMEYISDTYTRHGTLFVWNHGDESASKIASEVLVYSLDSGLYSRKIDLNSFVFTRYSSIDDDENILVNWVYYNGSESTKFASDVIR